MLIRWFITLVVYRKELLPLVERITIMHILITDTPVKQISTKRIEILQPPREHVSIIIFKITMSKIMHGKVFIAPLCVFMWNYDAIWNDMLDNHKLICVNIVNFCPKSKRRCAPGTGRRRYQKTLFRRAKNGFREGQVRRIKNRV